jgi:hypothetical protein
MPVSEFDETQDDAGKSLQRDPGGQGQYGRDQDQDQDQDHGGYGQDQGSQVSEGQDPRGYRPDESAQGGSGQEHGGSGQEHGGYGQEHGGQGGYDPDRGHTQGPYGGDQTNNQDEGQAFDQDQDQETGR